jgi:thioredoxin-related protein
LKLNRVVRIKSGRFNTFVKIYSLGIFQYMRHSLLIILFILGTVAAFSQSTPSSDNSSVKWYTIQDAYTDWCGWCKKMDKETFTNSVISDLLNNKFYPVKLNAEGKEDITFLGQKFVNDGKYGNAHQLAVALLQGQLSYPTVVFLTQENGKIGVSPVPGFEEAKQMEVLLTFFAEKAYLTGKWEDYQKSFVGKIK